MRSEVRRPPRRPRTGYFGGGRALARVERKHEALIDDPKAMRSRLRGITSQLSSEFIRLLGATMVNDAGGTHLVMANERFPVIDGIPILLKEPCRYLCGLSVFLETQLEKLKQFCGYRGDRSWAEPQLRELQKRLMAVRSVLLDLYGIESHTEAGIVPLQSKYDGEANTDIYTRIAWGYRSFPKGGAEGIFPDAGEFYTSLATLIRSHLPRSGVFLDLGCGVGRTVFDAAQIATEGLATGLDLSFSKIARARLCKAGLHSAIPFGNKKGSSKPGSEVRVSSTRRSGLAMRRMCC